ncbi:MAG: glycosyltransferase [Phycisphaerales bacterium]
MRIVLVNWARVWDGASHGGGVNGYTQSLALELLARGHEVYSLCGGTAYERAGTEVGPCRIRRHADWLGIRVAEVVNSPVSAPSLAQFGEPEAEVGSAELESQVAAFVRAVEPDAIHIQSLEGFTAGCVEAARRAAPRARVVFSLHNYHTLCPQVYLLQGHRRPCHDFRGGLACEGCVEVPVPARHRREQAGIVEPSDSFAGVRPAGLWAEAMPTGAGGAWGERRGTIGELNQQRLPAVFSGVDLPARRAILNVIQPESQAAANAYGRRRAAMIEMLNSCDRVLAVSEFVRRLYEARGVRGERLRTLLIGCRLVDAVAARPDAALAPPAWGYPTAGGARPVRMVFMGYHNWYKGLPMLLESLELLTPELLARLHLSVIALNGEHVEAEVRRFEPRLAGLRLVHGYRYHDLPWLLAGCDLGVVPSVWWDNGPQTVMEFQACGVPVLGAELGGIPDFVRHGENGLLFRGNDRYDLARTLAGVLNRPEGLEALRAGVSPPKGMAVHAAEVEAEYAPR